MSSLASDKFGIFRAYDIRGRYPEEINEKVVFEIGGFLSRYFKSGEIVVGYDARLSSARLYEAVLKGFARNNPRIKLIKIGLATTPMFYFLVNYFKAQGGAMVTASHNPQGWNGLKVTGEGAQMISGKKVLEFIRKEEN